MIDWLMQILAPRSALGFVTRLVILTGIVALENFAFSAMLTDDHHEISYYMAHAMFVGGPLIAFFLAVSVFQIRLQRKLWRMSRKDYLTGLDNRRSFIERTEKVRAADGRGILLILDADHFKDVNDSYGHQTGDNCLKSIAYTIARGVRREDIVGRIGGEEFAIYLKSTTRGQAKVIGERLTLPITFRSCDDDPLTITLSIGAVIATHGENLDALFVRADKALYRAKLDGRARLVFELTELVA